MWIWRKQNRVKTTYKEKKIIGIDTETRKGKAFLICDSLGNWIRVENWENAFKFLTQHHFRNSINFFWNIDYDFFGILKYLPKNIWEMIWDFGQADYGQYKIKYIPEKYFSLIYQRHEYRFYDLLNFYNMSLNSASKTYLNEEKLEVDVTKFNSQKFIEQNFEKIKEYCIRDAQLTAKLGQILKEKFKVLNVDFEKPFSVAYISSNYFINQTEIPIFRYAEYQQWALDSYFGGRFEVFKRGYFPKVYIYDINSAYPYQISKLLDISKGYWIKNTNKIDDAEIGFIKVRYSQEDDYIALLPYRQNSLVYFPNWKNREFVINLDEFKYIDKILKKNLEIIDAWLFFPNEVVYPFQIVEKIYYERKKLEKTDPTMAYTLKILLNSFYGKFIERQNHYMQINNPYIAEIVKQNGDIKEYYINIEKTGNLFCPIYANLITSRTRLQLFDIMRRYKKEIIACATDSITLTKPIMSESDKLGEWKLSGEGELVILGSGVYSLKNDGIVKTHCRGFVQPHRINLFELCEKYKNKKNIKINYTKVIKLGEVLAHDIKYDMNCLNEFVELEKLLDINFDEKRKWHRNFENCYDVLHNIIDSDVINV